MWRRPLPLAGSMVADRRVGMVVERVLERWVRVDVRSAVSPRRAR